MSAKSHNDLAGEQLRIVPGREPDLMIEEGIVGHDLAGRVCMFSGGNDSTVLAHRCRDHYDSLFHIDTGTAVPGVREFVEEFARELGKPLLIYEARDAFRTMVVGDDLWRERYRAAKADGPFMSPEEFEALQQARYGKGRPTAIYGQPPHGFPSPAAHGRAYSRLKERQIQAVVRDLKEGHSRLSRVLLLSGKRLAESNRRETTTKGVEVKGGQLYVNPLIDWTRFDMLRYRREHGLRQSDVAALLHRSGECNCGAFASAAEERALLKGLWPAWWGWIEALETEAEALGLRWSRWGGYDLAGNRCNDKSKERPGVACSSCEWRDQLGMELAA